MKTPDVSCWTSRGLALAIALAAGWSTTPPAAAAPPANQRTIQKMGSVLFGSSRPSASSGNSRYIVSQRPAASTTAPMYRAQREVVYQRPPTVVLPPAPATRARDPRVDPRLRDYMAAVSQAPRPVTGSDGRSRLSIPVTPEGPARAIAVPDNDPALEPQASPEVTMHQPLETPIRAEAVIAPTVYQGEPEYATPVFGRRGFVHPPSSAATATSGEEKEKFIIDVRNYEPGAKVKDPRTGLVFLVPPTA